MPHMGIFALTNNHQNLSIMHHVLILHSMSPAPKVGVLLSILEKKVKLKIISCTAVANTEFESKS